MNRGVAGLLAIVFAAVTSLALVCELQCNPWSLASCPPPASPSTHSEHSHHGNSSPANQHNPLPSHQQHCGDHSAFATLAPQLSTKPLASCLTVFDSLTPAPDLLPGMYQETREALARHHSLFLPLSRTIPLALRI